MNQRELRLAIALAAILILGGGYLAYKGLAGWKTRLDAREQAQAQRRVEADGLMQQQTFWKLRSDWLNSNLPEYKNRNEADNQLLTFVRESAKANDVDLTLSQLDPPEPLDTVIAAAMTVDAKAPYEKMWAWLHTLQANPQNFVSIRSVDMRPNLEDTKVLEVTELRVQKWFKKPSS
jgi:hypothetical protein